jgi:carboxyl-terminal processing protease
MRVAVRCLVSASALLAVLLSYVPLCADEVSGAKNPSRPNSTEVSTGSLPLEDLRTFARVFEQIRESYVEEVSDKTLLENAIRGMLGELDPHSAYLDEKDFGDLQNMTSGEFGGLGIEVGVEDGFVKVISPIDDTPASRAGIEAGDLIIKLDDKSVKGLSLDEAVNMMRGKQGEALTLTILRKSADRPLVIKVVRDIIKVKSVRYSQLESGYMYVRLAQFQGNTSNDLRKALEEIQKKSVIQGLVLDLRNNPGGLLNAAVDVADQFMNDGLIVYTKGRIKDADMRYSAKPGDILSGAPIVVLVNDGSASASEIVAGALQDSRRAVVMGTKSFGKGSVQTVMPISETKAIKLTTALYYTPSGRSIQAEGIKPDIVVERAKIVAIDEEVSASEADLNKHLLNGNNGADINNASADKLKQQEKKQLDGKKADTPIQDVDNQVHDALNVLKAIYLSKSVSEAPNTH